MGNNQYQGLAGAYDYIVQGVDFDGWIEYVEQITRKFNTPVATVADLACGTGNTTIPFAEKGYRATGVDIAPEMLARAREKARSRELAIDFIKQDIRKLNLARKFDLITCFHDGLNYLLSPRDLQQTFYRIHSHLAPGGMFIFDLNTVTWLAGTERDATMVDEPNLTLFWKSNYNKEHLTWQINVTGFIREGDYYNKFKETHKERAYTPEEVAPLLESSGLTLLNIYDAFTFSPPQPESRRHFYVSRRRQNRR